MNDEVRSQHTPVMQQYLRVNGQHPDMLLFYHGGFLRAVLRRCAPRTALLDITLTTRGQSAAEPIPMACVPFHAVDSSSPGSCARARASHLRAAHGSGDLEETRRAGGGAYRKPALAPQG